MRSNHNNDIQYSKLFAIFYGLSELNLYIVLIRYNTGPYFFFFLFVTRQF